MTSVRTPGTTDVSRTDNTDEWKEFDGRLGVSLTEGGRTVVCTDLKEIGWEEGQGDGGKRGLGVPWCNLKRHSRK